MKLKEFGTPGRARIPCAPPPLDLPLMDVLPAVQFLSFSCSFRQIFSQIIGWLTNLLGWHILIREVLDPPLRSTEQQIELLLCNAPVHDFIQNL